MSGRKGDRYWSLPDTARKRPRMAISLPVDVHVMLERLAEKRGVSRSRLIEMLIRREEGAGSAARTE